MRTRPAGMRTTARSTRRTSKPPVPPPPQDITAQGCGVGRAQRDAEGEAGLGTQRRRLRRALGDAERRILHSRQARSSDGADGPEKATPAPYTAHLVHEVTADDEQESAHNNPGEHCSQGVIARDSAIEELKRRAHAGASSAIPDNVAQSVLAPGGFPDRFQMCLLPRHGLEIGNAVPWSSVARYATRQRCPTGQAERGRRRDGKRRRRGRRLPPTAVSYRIRRPWNAHTPVNRVRTRAIPRSAGVLSA